jgi:hypothetical protein
MPVEFVAMIEAGELERQALWLCASIRRFGGRHRDAPITAISPRASRRPSRRSLAALKRLGVTMVDMDISSPCPDYGTSFRVLACSEYEERARAESLVVLDSDTLFLGEPQLDLDGCDAAVRPVDLKGMCTTGADDERDPYWRELCRLNGVDYSVLPFVVTTVDKRTVRASYNGGFVVTRAEARVFRRTAEYWLRAAESGLSPWAGTGLRVLAGHGVVSEAGSAQWGSAQACLSLALWASRCRVKTLPETHNFPLHLYDQLPPSSFPAGDVVHVHYHHLFAPGQGSNALLEGRKGFPPDAAEWVRALVASGESEAATTLRRASRLRERLRARLGRSAEDRDPVAPLRPPLARKPVRVVAVLAAHNEEHCIGGCIEHYRRHGIGVYLIDNESTDATREIAERYAGDGLVGIETLPRGGIYDLQRILERKTEIAAMVETDWIIHADPDEMRLPPRSDITLAEALTAVDREGYNAVNFQEYTFVPTLEEPDHEHSHFRQTMRWYYPFLPDFPHQLKAWKHQPDPVDLVSTAGHRVDFPGLRMYPRSFPMRHYPFLSIEHAIRKYVQRPYSEAAVAQGWHGRRATVKPHEITLLSERDLRRYESDETLDPSSPRSEHPHLTVG